MRRLVRLALGLTVGLSLSPPSYGATDAKSLRNVSSKTGGYSVSIPLAWSAQEHVEGNSYLAIYAHDPADQPPRMNAYSLEIRRVIRWRGVLEIQAGPAKEATLEYANRLARSMGGSQPAVVIAAGRESYGMDLYYFYIVAGDGPDRCTTMRFLAGVRGDEWFHALWKSPCAEFEEHHDQISQMRESLRVVRAWSARRR